ncbi:sensor histidine kinase, partial [Pseudonocardia benzenivorans]
MTRLRRWWTRRTLRFRITLVVGAVALVALLALSRLGAGLVASTLTGSADAELRVQATDVAGRVHTGAPPAAGPAVRVVDTAGDPVDGQQPLPLRGDVGQLLTGAV